MMHPTDHGLVIVCGEWDDVNRYIVEHGLDPAKVIKPHGSTYAWPFQSEQVIILDGWTPDESAVEWFWWDVGANMFTQSEAEQLYERAKAVTGLLPETAR